jgi:hypothetical protein
MIKTIKLLAVCVLMASCSTGNHPDYEANTATAQKYFELHQAENPEAMFELLHNEMEWHMPVYGSEMADLETFKAAIINYQSEFDNMNFTARSNQK